MITAPAPTRTVDPAGRLLLNIALRDTSSTRRLEAVMALVGDLRCVVSRATPAVRLKVRVAGLRCQCFTDCTHTDLARLDLDPSGALVPTIGRLTASGTWFSYGPGVAVDTTPVGQPETACLSGVRMACEHCATAARVFAVVAALDEDEWARVLCSAWEISCRFGEFVVPGFVDWQAALHLHGIALPALTAPAPPPPARAPLPVLTFSAPPRSGSPRIVQLVRRSVDMLSGGGR